MLIIFKVKNYTSFKEEAILDLRATSYKQHPSHIIKINEKMNLLKTTAIYGANASGKSNFIAAMFFFKQYIFSQFIDKDSSFDTATNFQKFKLEPFELVENENPVSEFEIIFIKNDNQIQYGFECTDKKVLSEWLYINDKKVFERSETSISFGSKYNPMLSAYDKVPEARLYISVLEYFLDEKAKEFVLNDFKSFFNNDFNVFSEILFESTVKGLAGSIGISSKIVENETYRNQVEHYLSKIDVGIKSLKIENVTIMNEKTGEKKKEKVVRTVHNVYDNNGKLVGETTLALQKESTGTLRFLSYIQKIIDVVSDGGIFIIDEFSARLHPLLTKLIVDIFSSSNNNKAQLIFTNHDISLLNKEQFRRDEVVFIDKNERGESSLYSLSDLKIREDATFNKDYLQGKYGAIPIFNYDEIIGGESNA